MPPKGEFSSESRAFDSNCTLGNIHPMGPPQYGWQLTKLLTSNTVSCQSSQPCVCHTMHGTKFMVMFTQQVNECITFSLLLLKAQRNPDWCVAKHQGFFDSPLHILSLVFMSWALCFFLIILYVAQECKIVSPGWRSSVVVNSHDYKSGK